MAASITPERLHERLEWFADQKLGFFVHWGPYSQWGCIESWPLVADAPWARPDDLPAWAERDHDLERFRRDYFALNRTFNPTRFDPDAWAEAAADAGFRYFVLTTKHHDGFCLYDTRQTDYRVTHPDCPYSRAPQPDIVRAAFDAFRRHGLAIGVYFSKSDWHSPHYWDPARPAPDRHPNYDTLAEPERWERFVQFVHGQIGELTSQYGPVDILWLDGGQVRPPKQDIRMDEIAALARRHQPDLLVVDRTVGGEHENYRTPEQQVPDEPLPYAWESCLTLGRQWSYRPDDAYKSTREVIHLVVDIVAKGGNLLLNVGPQPDGQLPPPALERLRALGAWLRVNGEAIYGTRPIAPYKEGDVALTQRGDTVYAVVLAGGDGRPPAQVRLSCLQPQPGALVRLLGVEQPLAWRAEGAGFVADLPEAVRAHPPCDHAWVLAVPQP